MKFCPRCGKRGTLHEVETHPVHDDAGELIPESEEVVLECVSCGWGGRIEREAEKETDAAFVMRHDAFFSITQYTALFHGNTHTGWLLCLRPSGESPWSMSAKRAPDVLAAGRAFLEANYPEVSQ